MAVVRITQSAPVEPPASTAACRAPPLYILTHGKARFASPPQVLSLARSWGGNVPAEPCARRLGGSLSLRESRRAICVARAVPHPPRRAAFRAGAAVLPSASTASADRAAQPATENCNLRQRTVRCRWLQRTQAERTGAEPPQNSRPRHTSGADCGALAVKLANSPRSEASTPDLALAAIIAAWPTLPPAIRAGVIALVRVAGGGHE